ncbi:unnamed protein product [Urochloa humidicola]
MASPPARSFAFSSFLQWFFTFAAGPPAVPEFYSYDAFVSARNGDPNQRTEKVTKDCDEGFKQQDAIKGETLRQGSRFILDSGASHHVAGDISLLSSVRTTIPPTRSAAATYRARDGRHLPITGVGTVSRGSFQLHDVLLAPDLCSRVVIVSVTQLAEHGNLVMFGGGQCYVKDQSSGKLVGKGRWHGDDGLYHLEYLDISPETEVAP